MLLLLSAVASGGLATVGALVLRIDAFARSRPPPSAAKAIVVLGARVVPPGTPSPALQRRTEKAVELYRGGLAPVILFTGGVAGSLPSEASVAREVALKLGVPAEACVVEERSHSTRQNAAFAAPLLAARSIDEVLLVSDGYHLLRAQLLFAELGIRSQPVASDRELTAATRAWWTTREAVALLKRPQLLWR